MLAIEDISNKLTFDLLTLKVVSESRVTWAISVPILVIGLSVLELGPIYATDRRTDVRQKHRLMHPPYGGRGIIITIECRISVHDVATISCHTMPGDGCASWVNSAWVIGICGRHTAQRLSSY